MITSRLRTGWGRPAKSTSATACSTAAILNHSPGSTQGITAIYNRHRYGDEKRQALAAWGREVERIIGRAEAKVVALAS
jgi:hypothetical protein